MKKHISILLAVLMLFSMVCIAVSAEDQKDVVVLGDSIAQGYGISNRDEACYGRIVADTIGYGYSNYGHDGDQSSDLLGKLNRNSKGMCDTIKDAELALISIGGNDFLQHKKELGKFVVSAAFGSVEEIDAIQKNFAENFAKIIEKIYSLNPEITIVVQTLYNGHTGAVEWAYSLAVERVNQTILSYKNENPSDFILVEISNLFNNHREYFAVDTLHPSAEGNKAIAQEIINVLYDEGISPTQTLVINAKGKDQINGFSAFLKKILDFFRKLFGIQTTSF